MTRDTILDSDDSEAICLAVNNLDDTIVESAILDSIGRVIGANVKVTRFADKKNTDFNDTHGAMLALVYGIMNNLESIAGKTLSVTSIHEKYKLILIPESSLGVLLVVRTLKSTDALYLTERIRSLLATISPKRKAGIAR